MLPQIGYFLKNLDQSNVNNAFLSGMKEDLAMNGNQLVTSTSIWTVGYVIGQIPSNLLLTRVSPRWVIPSVRLRPLRVPQVAGSLMTVFSLNSVGVLLPLPRRPSGHTKDCTACVFLSAFASESKAYLFTSTRRELYLTPGC